ncbi:hypothetical protein L7F22_014904 [Adiantum nelumboides]|nr:hypothetical protein [Adiantum nelumboides]
MVMKDHQGSIRSGGRNDATPPRAPPIEEAPSRIVTMEKSTIGKKKEPAKGKQKGPAYKLQSDIELATNLKKVPEERILNSKVELTLGEMLGIVKHEFHEEIIHIIKRKRQTLGEVICSQVEEEQDEVQEDKLDMGYVKESMPTNEDMQVNEVCGTVLMTMLVKMAIESAIVVQQVQSLSRKDEVVFVVETEQVCFMAHEDDSQTVASFKPSKEICALWLKGMLVV